MKKLFAILAVLVLATTMSFANDTWTSATNLSGTYTATVVCAPVLAGPAASIPNIFLFDDFNGDPGTAPLVWTLKGDELARYTISCGYVLTTKPSGSNPAAITNMSWGLYTNAGVQGQLLTSNAASATFTSVDFEGYGMTCSAPISIKGDVDGINAAGKDRGQYVWTITVSVSATI